MVKHNCLFQYTNWHSNDVWWVHRILSKTIKLANVNNYLLILAYKNIQTQFSPFYKRIANIKTWIRIQEEVSSPQGQYYISFVYYKTIYLWETQNAAFYQHKLVLHEDLESKKFLNK